MLSHMSIRIWDVPYAYGPIYAYGAEQIYLYYAGNFSYYAGIMLYAFQPLLCLKLCRHNRRRPSYIGLSGSLLIL